MSSIEGDYFIPDNTQLDDFCRDLKKLTTKYKYKVL